MSRRPAANLGPLKLRDTYSPPLVVSSVFTSQSWLCHRNGLASAERSSALHSAKIHQEQKVHHWAAVLLTPGTGVHRLFVWRRHGNVSSCTDSSVNVIYERIASRVRGVITTRPFPICQNRLSLAETFNTLHTTMSQPGRENTTDTAVWILICMRETDNSSPCTGCKVQRYMIYVTIH